jgi:hypothetical protein
MFVAIRIWTKLNRSIPPDFRRYYFLIPDPTAGKVTVVARMPTLEIPGLWSVNPPDARPENSRSEKQGLYSQLRNSIRAMSMPFTAHSTAMMARNATMNNTGSSPSLLCIERQYLLGRTWMLLVDYCGLILNHDEHDAGPSDEVESRLMVASDTKASDRTPLKMQWPQFVWLALALGVSPYDPGWQSSYPRTLKNSENEDSIHLFYEEDRLIAKVALKVEFTYSLRRAFGWYNIELDGDRLLALGNGESVPRRLKSVTISPELSACRIGMDLNKEGTCNTVIGKEPQDCTNALAAACCWMFSWRRQRRELDQLLPVSQHVLEYRQRALCHLKLLEKEGKLNIGVRSLVLAKNIEDLDLQSVWDASAELLDSIIKATPLKTGVMKKDQLAKEELLSAQTQNIVGPIIRQLRSSFASSTYVDRHAELSRRIKSSHMKTSPEELLLLEPEWSSLEPKSGQSIKGRKEEDIYDLLPSNLRAEFESAVQLWASNPDGHITCWNGRDGIGFLACIALALANWDIYGQEAWQLRDDLQSAVDQLRKTIVDASQGKDSLITPSIKSARIHTLRGLSKDVCCNILSKGLYAAPSANPVTSLLHSREETSTVYLS